MKVILCAIIAAAVIVALGRWERARAVHSQNAAMRTVFRAAGSSLTSSVISGYRFGPPNCLAYYKKPVRYALQLCFDESGRLVETVDRRYGKPRYASLTWDSPRATLRLSPSKIHALLERISGRH